MGNPVAAGSVRRGSVPQGTRPMRSSILLVEDELDSVVTVSDLLALDGYHVEAAPDGESGLARAVEGAFDLLILDVVLPRKTGFDVCRELRQRGMDTAIFMLAAKTQLSDLVVGLRLGADDYMVKPFDPSEFLARVEALLRRVRKAGRIPVKSFQFGDVEVDFEQAEAHKAGRTIGMTSKELQLLRYLVNNRQRIVSRQEILRDVWEYHREVSSRTIDVHVAWLRQKLEDNPQNPKHIETIRGKGYRFIG